MALHRDRAADSGLAAWLRLLFAATLLIGTLAGAQQPPPPGLEGAWVLRELGPGRMPLPDLPITLVFRDGDLEGSLEGSAGCNDYRAGYTVDDANTLELADIYATRRTCEPLILAQEAEFLTKLQGATRFELREGDLVLEYQVPATFMGAFGSLRFERQIVPDTLTRAAWRWLQYEDPMVGSVAIASPDAFRLSFGNDGRATLATDCLRAELPYAVTGSSLYLNPRGVDLTACPPGSPSHRLVRDLAFVGLFSVDEGRLLLELYADSGALLFEAAP